MSIQEIINDLKGLLSWSDRIGSDEISTINDIVYQLENKLLDEQKFINNVANIHLLPTNEEFWKLVNRAKELNT